MQMSSGVTLSLERLGAKNQNHFHAEWPLDMLEALGMLKKTSCGSNVQKGTGSLGCLQDPTGQVGIPWFVRLPVHAPGIAAAQKSSEAFIHVTPFADAQMGSCDLQLCKGISVLERQMRVREFCGSGATTAIYFILMI